MRGIVTAHDQVGLLSPWQRTAAADPSYLKGGKCKYCKNPATRSILHSEGMAYVQTCDKHLKKGKDDAAACVPYGGSDPSNIDKIYDLGTKRAIESSYYTLDDMRHGPPPGTRPIVRHPDGSIQELTDWVHTSTRHDKSYCNVCGTTIHGDLSDDDNPKAVWLDRNNDEGDDTHDHWPEEFAFRHSGADTWPGKTTRQRRDMWHSLGNWALDDADTNGLGHVPGDEYSHVARRWITGGDMEPNSWSAKGSYWFHPDPKIAHTTLDVAMPVSSPEHAEQVMSQYPRSHRLKLQQYPAGNGTLSTRFDFGTDTRSGEANEASMKRYKTFRARAERNGHQVNFDGGNDLVIPAMPEDDFHGHIGLQGPQRQQELHDARAERDRIKFAPRNRESSRRGRPMSRQIVAARDQVAMQEPWRLEAIRKGAPFAGYEDFDACTSQNADKDRPDAYCGEIKHRTEDKKASRWYVAYGDPADVQDHPRANQTYPELPMEGEPPEAPDPRHVPEGDVHDPRPTKPSAQWGADVMRHLDKNPWGVTVRDQIGDAPSSGYMVSHPGAEAEQSRSGVDPHKIRDYYDQHFDQINQDPGNSYGGWDAPRTPESGRGGQPGWYHDVSQNIKDPGAAADAAVRGNQQAVYDLNKDQEVSTPDMVKRSKGGAVNSLAWLR